MEILGSIYKITNNLNGRVYIGQTVVPIEYRMIQHISDVARHSSNRLHLAMEQWGIKNFSIETVERVPINQLNEREIFYIKKFNSFVEGYNSTLGGGYDSYKRGFTKLDDYKEQIIALYLAGYSSNNIANNFNLDKKTVVFLLQSCGVPIRGPKKMTLNEEEKQEIILKYNLGRSLKSLGEEYDLSGNTVKRLLLSKNVPIKDKVFVLKDENLCREILEYYIKNEVTYQEVMSKFNICFSTLKKILKGYKKPYRERIKLFSDNEIIDIIQKYQNGIKIRKIAKLYNRSYATIKKILDKKGVLKTV